MIASTVMDIHQIMVLSSPQQKKKKIISRRKE
jgi:hypothetical protein